MKINSAKTETVEKTITLSITVKRKTFEVTVYTIDGKVQGDGIKGYSTSYLTYFHVCSDTVRKKHFNQIKKYVERYIK